MRQQAYKRQWRLENPDKVKAHRDAATQRRRDWLAEHKAGPCLDCGQTFPACVMDFDHRPGEEKVADISFLLGSARAPLTRILEEIAKCDLVCANCHRIRTWSRS